MRSDPSDRATYIRDQLLRELHEDMGGIVAHGAWYNLFVNMTYRGVYNLVERIDKNFLSSVFPEEGENWDVWNGDAVDGDGTSWNELFEFFLEGDLSNEALYERALELVNIEDFTAYIILHIWAQNHDWPPQELDRGAPAPFRNQVALPHLGWRVRLWPPPGQLHCQHV